MRLQDLFSGGLHQSVEGRRAVKLKKTLISYKDLNLVEDSLYV